MLIFITLSAFENVFEGSSYYTLLGIAYSDESPDTIQSGAQSFGGR